MTFIFILVIYIIICLLCALSGSNKSTGYGGAFLLCLFLSPVIGLIIALVAPYKIDYSQKDQVTSNKYICKYCKYQSSDKSYYCPRCLRDSDGLTVEQNKIKYSS